MASHDTALDDEAHNRPMHEDPFYEDPLHNDTANDDTKAALQRLYAIRESIDNIDAALVHLLAERFKFTQFVGTLKAVHGLPPADPAREHQQIKRLRALAAESHLDPEFAEKWFNFVVAEVIHHHVATAEALDDEDAMD